MFMSALFGFEGRYWPMLQKTWIVGLVWWCPSRHLHRTTAACTMIPKEKRLVMVMSDWVLLPNQHCQSLRDHFCSCNHLLLAPCCPSPLLPTTTTTRDGQHPPPEGLPALTPSPAGMVSIPFPSWSASPPPSPKAAWSASTPSGGGGWSALPDPPPPLRWSAFYPPPPAVKQHGQLSPTHPSLAWAKQQPYLAFVR
jgi:hypothetical protein